MSSTRLKSEEIYRERITSDSLFAARTRNPANSNSASTVHANSNSNNNNNNANNQQQLRQEEHEREASSALLQDDVFDQDDLFGPPPLPSKSDTKRTKSKVSSLFDDSDSGDELFSAASSGSRSQKSTDFLAAVPPNDKTKPAPRTGGLFDDTDIFGGKDNLDVDLFGTVSKLKSKNVIADGLFDSRGQDSIASKSSNDKSPNTRMEPKKISLFDDDDDGDLFSAKPKSTNEHKTDLFEDKNDLFLSSKASNKGHSSVEKSRSIESKNNTSKDIPVVDVEEKSKDPPGNGLFSNTRKINSLFVDDDYDDLFSKTKTAVREDVQSKPTSKEEDKKDVVENVQKLSGENKSSMSEFSSLERDAKTATESNVVINRMEKDVNGKKNKTDVVETFRTEDVDGMTRKSPPKTLNIRTTPSPSDEGGQVPRKSVSGKIKNLMGKMGDLKILSPMDAPPLWRKSEEKVDEDEDVVDRDSDNGGQIAGGRVSPPSVSEGSTRKESSYSTISNASNAEVPISFDLDLVQVETLSTTASKSRVRIQAKRRPQSRHARKSALRHSGIDFDTVDNADNDSQEESHTSSFSHTSTKDLSTASVTADRLTASDGAQRTIDPTTDDKSELGSVSKESSMSINKNTLLSPSTDEEDLFDVPPDLPEDPPKEDTLFGRAPILSPVDDEQSDKTPVAAKSLKDIVKSIEDDANMIRIESNKQQESDKQDFGKTMQSDQVDVKSDTESKSYDKRDKKYEEMNDEQDEDKTESTEEPSDPLRDSSHDPLKNPSQLFAFVTKTPSPDKGKGLLFSEDDSLFSSGVKRSNEERPSQKKILDLFADDVGDDLFSAPLKKTVKKPPQDAKISLFDDDDGDAQNDEDDSLFGMTSKVTQSDAKKSTSATKVGYKKNNIFDDEDDDDDSSLFVESSGQSQKSDSMSEPKHDFADAAKSSSNLKNIFGDDTPCDDDDIFATKKVVPKKVAPSKSLFASDDDDDDGHIFGKASALTDSKAKTTITSSRAAIKKPVVTRDLKKTAEKIVEDPLSLLQDD